LRPVRVPTVNFSVFHRLTLFVALSIPLTLNAEEPASTRDWLSWRGPFQNGTSNETGLTENWTVGGDGQLFAVDLPGRGTPAIYNGKLFTLSFRGEGEDLTEDLVCLDAETGKELWAHHFHDFLSDVIYLRYTLGSVAVDPETKQVYALSTAGELTCFTLDGKLVWQHALMDEMGKMTFPNSRTGGPLLDGDLAIVHGITANWGGQGVPADRFYAYDKKTGALVWESNVGVNVPGVRPKDNSFSYPVLANLDGMRVLLTGTGCGHVACVNARTGDVLWRFLVSMGGVNSSVVKYNNTVIAIHGSENIDATNTGRMVSIKLDAKPEKTDAGPLLPKSAEAWRNELSAFSCSPVLVGDTLYQVNESGELCAVDAKTGTIAWRTKLAIDQRHASPLYADGKLYVAMREGTFYIIKPTDKEGVILSKVKLEGECDGSPCVANGKIYIQTTKKLYAIGKAGDGHGGNAVPAPEKVTPGEATVLQIVPAEVLLRPGQKVALEIRKLDAKGNLVGVEKTATWKAFVPPTAKVQAYLNANIDGDNALTAKPDNVPSAGMFEATAGTLKGYVRGRIVNDLPMKEDFEGADLKEKHATEAGVMFAYPPLPWIGARFRWEIRDKDGSKVLTKTIDNKLFQRAMTFIGAPDMSNYSVECDVMSDGTKRKMSEVGQVNQRYMIILKGNSQELEINSNLERFRVSVPFSWSPNVWYHMKSRVDLAADGSGTVRAKVWKRGEAEPEKWTIEAPHKQAHACGSPGLFGYAPQELRVYVDNLTVTPNK